MLKGSIVALILPFRNGEIDYEQFEKLIEYHIENGTHGILCCGTTGESATISHQEHIEIINFTVKKAAKRIDVLAGTGSNSTREAVELAKAAKAAGADAHLSITPYYNKPTQEGLYLHFKAVADEVDMPMVVYNVPGRTGVNITPETMARIAEIPQVVGVKEATGNIRQATEIVEYCPPDFNLYSGDDFSNFPMMAVGAKGAISVTANIAPKLMSDMFNKWFTDDPKQHGEARKIHMDLMALHRGMFYETNPIPVKTAAYLMGIIDHLEFRLPLCPLSSMNEEKLKILLKERGMIG